MSQLEKIVKLTKSQYESMMSASPRQISYTGGTHVYNENNLYVTTDETFSAEDLDNDFILPVSKGGTGKTSFTSGSLLVGNGQNALTEIGATDQNTANTIVKRDSSGNFSAGTITASLSGNATTSYYPYGFSSRPSSAAWGNTTGTYVTSWDIGSSCIAFMKDNPSSGKLSAKIDGRFYIAEGAIPVAGLKAANSYWGMTGPDGEDNIWIRTTSQGIIPYQSGGASAGHCQLGTDSWYFSKGYIQDIYGTLHGGAALTGTPTAPTAADGTNTTQIATTAFVHNTLKYADAMIFKGTIGTGGTVTALPDTHDAGWTYKVITAGTYAGMVCEVGDLIICIKDGTTAANADWTSVQTNDDGLVTSSSTDPVDNAIVRYDGTTGKIIQKSTTTINDTGTMNIKGKLIVNPSYDTSNSYNEGIRINLASNGWANIHFGGTADSTNGTNDGGWLLGRRGAAGSITGAIGDFTIEEQNSTGCGLTLHKDSGGMEIYTALAYDKSQLKIRNNTSIAAGKFGWAINATSTMAATSNSLILVGAASSTKNQAYLGFHYEASGSDSNYLTLGFYGVDHLLTIYPTGQTKITKNISSTSTTSGSLIVTGGVGVGEKLYVSSETHSEKYIVNENVTLQWNSTDSALEFVFA